MTRVIITADGTIYANGDVEVQTQLNHIEPLRTAAVTVLTIEEFNRMECDIIRKAYNRFRAEEMNENEEIEIEEEATA